MIRELTNEFLSTHAQPVSLHVRSTLRRLQVCRTAALGGHVYSCRSCQSELPVYNSCGDRHCPLCRGARRVSWVEQAQLQLHPSITYFQVVFTLPEELSGLLLGNRRVGYRLLFHAAWQALQQSIEAEADFQPAATMVLHTWNQRLGHHPHLHALVPGNGPSRDGTTWTECRRTRGSRSTPSRPFLVDHRRLGHRFRDSFLAGLRQLIEKKELSCQEDQLRQQMALLAKQDWVVFIQPPPAVHNDPAQVLKYLARYMTGGPIGDRRLVSVDASHVQILARAADKTGRQIPTSLTRHEFLRRWCLHILPKGFTKVRSMGGWSSTRKSHYSQLVQALAPRDALPRRDAKAIETPSRETAIAEAVPTPCCPHCQLAMTLIWTAPRRTWRDLFYPSPDAIDERTFHWTARGSIP